MARIAYGYGSEWHLLRWMGRHRQVLDKMLLSTIQKGGWKIEWIDFNFKRGETWPDAELKGLEFLNNYGELKNNWETFWPVGSGIHNWDAVGWVYSGEDKELLLIEAKANIQEVVSNCQAKDKDSIKKIRHSLELVKKGLGVNAENDWAKKYYQFANRMAILYFLHQHSIPAHLVFIYFIGDRSGKRRTCPQSTSEWKSILKDQKEYMGLPKGHPLEARIQELFLRIDGEQI